MLDLLASQRPLFFLNYKPSRLLLNLQPVYLQSYQLITAHYSRIPRTKMCLTNSLALFLAYLSSEFDEREQAQVAACISMCGRKYAYLGLDLISNDRNISATDFIFQKKNNYIYNNLRRSVCFGLHILERPNRRNSRDYKRDIAQRCPITNKIPLQVA